MVAKALNARVYSPKQLTGLAEEDRLISEAEISQAFIVAYRIMVDFIKSRSWAPERAAKSKELVTAILNKEFPLKGN
ncbi:hypothetical protein ACFO1B_30945 [Dactylosporangium siamense]|uniref:hypothetical protein n=1 Tax=Dactylosporangium siamense TaxID=685454 RepID=UPI00194441B3|nr:hypothetical protein [Dactylosporangium siamense]